MHLHNSVCAVTEHFKKVEGCIKAISLAVAGDSNCADSIFFHFRARQDNPIPSTAKIDQTCTDKRCYSFTRAKLLVQGF